MKCVHGALGIEVKIRTDLPSHAVSVLSRDALPLTVSPGKKLDVPVAQIRQSPAMRVRLQSNQLLSFLHP
jgi:hypothetical protein